jgi:predicted ATPase
VVDDEPTVSQAGDPARSPPGEGRSGTGILHTLGVPEFQPVGPFQGKALVLLSYLSLNGPQPRRRIAALFWPHATDPLNRLSVTLARIRAVAEQAVGGDRRHLWTELVTDAALMTQALDAGRTDEALALYRGAFLTEAYPSDVSAELEEWIAATRDGFARRIQLIRLEAAGVHAKSGRFEVAAEEAGAAIASGGTSLLDPDELARIHTLLLAGGHPAALAVGHEAEALGVAVAVTGDEARARLRHGPAYPSTRSNLRSHGAVFVGRDAERLELARMLALPERRLITLTGPGGTGKTRLALRVAADQLEGEQHLQGVFVVALEDAPSADAIPTAIAEALAITIAQDRAPLVALVEAIRDRHLLLILDNLEHLRGAGAVLEDLLAACRNVTLLATSRDRLATGSEWLFPVGGLAVPRDAPDAADAHAWSALTLFETRAQRVQPDFLLTRDTIPHVVAICALVHGSPLAIELAASHVAIMPVAEIAAEVHRSLDVLVATTQDGPERHQSMRVVFDHAWWNLDDDERETLQLLTVFHGGFDRESARTVAGATLPILASLVTQALVVRRGERFDLHPLIHKYAAEKLAGDATAEDEARRRHATWALDLAATAFARRNTVDGGRWLDRLDLEHANLRAALMWADAAGEATTLAGLTNALESFWVRRGYHAEALQWFGALRRHAPALDASEVARSLRSHAFVAILSGAYDVAADLLGASLGIARDIGDGALESRVRSHMGILAVYRERYVDAARHYADALAIARSLNERDTIARLQNNLGDVARFRGDLTEARRHYVESLTAVRALDDRQMVSNVLGSLSQVALAEGCVHEARTLLRESIELLRELGITFSVPVAFGQAANLASLTGRHLDAARLWGASHALRQRLHIPVESFVQREYRDAVAAARAATNGPTFGAAWFEGQHLGVPEATSLALAICRDTASKA